MTSKLHFISGLPRSGSTLLSAILKQNPRFIAGMTSPVSTLFRGMEDVTSTRVETSIFLTEEKRKEILKGLFETYYRKDWNDKTIFDTSRMWCARTSVLANLFPDSKIICCVREVGWILDSFERLYRKNQHKPSGIYNYDTAGTVYSRTWGIADGNGVLGYALNALKEAYYSEESGRLILVDYDKLCQDPRGVIENVYKFLDEPVFEHDFNNIEYSAGEFDKQFGAEGLHDVRGKVEWKPRKSIIPPDLFMRFREDNFWKRGGT